MESIKKQVAKLLGEKKKYRAWLAMFLCLALLVTAGTVTALTMSGQALNHMEKVLDCQVEVHQHSGSCYDAGGQLICGQADYVLHVHNDDCYNGEGELACRLPEIRAHEHTEDCYGEVQVLICEEKAEPHSHTEECSVLACGEEESEGHVHTAECSTVVCGQEESEGHVHTADCDQLICGEEESEGHVHTADCDRLICGTEESEGHVHTADCDKVICGKSQTQGHLHTADCYTKVKGDLACTNDEEGHEHTDECYDWTEELTCGIEEGDGAHEHTEECYEREACGIEEGEGAHIHTEECYEHEACGIEEGEGAHIHTEECYEREACGLEEEEGAHVHTSQCYDASACEAEESVHVHTDACYEQTACGLEEGESAHVHTEECYTTEIVLICGMSARHTHTGSCYDADGQLSCGLLEVKEHTHGENCFVTVVVEPEATAQSIYDDGSIHITAEYTVSGNMPESVELTAERFTVEADGAAESAAHVGASAAQIVPVIDVSGNDTASADVNEMEAAAETDGMEADETEGSTAPADVSGNEGAAIGGGVPTDSGVPSKVIEEYVRLGFRADGEDVLPDQDVTFTIQLLDENGEAASAPIIHTYTAGDGSEGLVVLLGREVVAQQLYTKTYEDDSIRVVAEYYESANIPEEARLIARQITEESDPELYAVYEEEFKKAVGNEDADLDTLFDIGFYMDGKEIEPENTVKIQIQFLDEDGTDSKDKIMTVHFAEEGTEVLEGSTSDQGDQVTFTTNSFSPFGFANVVAGIVGKGKAGEERGAYVSTGAEWGKLADLPENGDSIYIQDMKFLFASGVQSLFNEYWPNSAPQEGDRWIGYSTDGGKTITTAKYNPAFGFWAMDGGDQGDIYWNRNNTPDPNNSTYKVITGLYYLPGNRTEYVNAELDPALFSTLPSVEVVFNPGNKLEEGGTILQYRLDERVTIKAPVTEIDGKSATTVILPDDANIGLEFDFNGNESSGDASKPEVLGTIPRAGTDKYPYRLAGWYNLGTGSYYSVENGPVKVTLEADGSVDHVFYADWVAEDYNFASRNREVEKENEKEPTKQLATEDTKDFIKTRVYDFNELFNLYSAELRSNEKGTYDIWYDSGIFHTSPWFQSEDEDGCWKEDASTCSSFLFLGNGGNGSLVLPVNRTTGNISSDENLRQGTWNNPVILNKLFDDSALGVHYIGEGNFLYQHVGAEDQIGYYEYDSDKHAALYEESENRFYVYQRRMLLSTTDKGYVSSFLPFNTFNFEKINGEDRPFDYVADNDRAINYNFGLCSEIEFYLPKNPSEDGGGNQIDGNDMKFEFSGDDDVWVYVDDVLVLDMGGIHGKMYGEINFSTGMVTTYSEAKPYDRTVTKISDKISAGEHKLTIYYLERGAGLSNCKIKFNIVPRYKIETATANAVKVTKEWKNVKQDEIPESIELSLYRKANRTKWVQETATEEQIKKLCEKLNMTEEQFKSFKSKLESEFALCENDFTLVETVKLKTAGVEEAAYTWEGLSPYFEYEVRESVVPSYLTAIEQKTSQSAHKSWVEVNKLEDGEFLILNYDKTKALACKDGVLTQEDVRVENGVVIMRKVWDDHGNVIGQAMPESIIWKAVPTDESSETFCIQSNEGSYLLLDKDMLQISEKQIAFKLDSAFGNGLCNDAYRVVYENGAFSSKVNNGNDNVNSNTDSLRVRIYKKETVFSQADNYIVTNTYVPNIVIQKVDSESDQIIKNSEAARFTLIYEKVDDTGAEITKYYDGNEWIDGSMPDNFGGFQMERGFLQFDALPDGEYTLTEIAAPEGYLLPEKEEDRRIVFTLEGARITDVESKNLTGSNPENVVAKNAAEVVGDDRLTLIVRNEKEASDTVDVTFIKVGDSDNTLSGAEFELYRKATEDDKKDHPNDVKEVPGIDGEVILINEVKASGKDGVFYTGALEVDTLYYLCEVKSPLGYNMLTEIVVIEIKKDAEGKVNVECLNDSMGVSIKGEQEEGEEKSFEIRIKNVPGFLLPETGSVGTKPFTIGGMLLAVIAAGTLMYGCSMWRKKRERRSK